MTLKRYFSLEGPTPVMGASGTQMKSQVLLFLGVLLGAFSKEIYNYFDSAVAMSAPSLAVAAIASIVVFPQLYYVGGLDKRRLSFAHWTLAFQNGFFWSFTFAEIVKRFATSH
jgi:uncharacterized membrane protein